jgi:phosphoribosylaminoimidazole-succinocarboxamide synthase
MPEMPDEFVNLVTNRYIELYNKITGTEFIKADTTNISNRIEENVNRYLAEYC